MSTPKGQKLYKWDWFSDRKWNLGVGNESLEFLPKDGVFFCVCECSHLYFSQYTHDTYISYITRLRTCAHSR